MKKYKNKKKRLIALAVVLVLLLAAAAAIVVSLTRTAPLPDTEQARQLLYDAAYSLTGAGVGDAVAELRDALDIEVTGVEHDGTGCLVSCTVSSVPLGNAVETYAGDIRALAEPDANGETMKSDAMKAAINDMLSSWYSAGEPKSVDLSVVCADVGGKWQVYASRDFADACYGGLASVTQGLDGSDNNADKRLKTCIEVKYDAEEPDTRNWIKRGWDSFRNDFRMNFIDDARWMMIVRGLATTLEVTFFAVIIGIVLGFLVAIVRVTHDKTQGMGFLNGVAKIYLTVIRGTPVLVQLMIIYFVILAPIRAPKVVVAIIAFGINSGAYVAEIVRGGIMSIDQGQTEAGRSLGFNYAQTMLFIVLPQAFKAVLPALANEFIVLLKETSVSAYIALEDLTRAGDKIRGATYSAFMPLIAVAIIYLAMVMILSYFVGKLERRLRKSDRG